MQSEFLKFDPYNFVPLSRTPWGGELIIKTKKQILRGPETGWPDRIGESWEISTDAAFPSRVRNLKDTEGNHPLFTELLHDAAEYFLGKSISSTYGAHCPLLLKWLNANDPLSVQVHPTHSHPALKPEECGKPESWLVLSTLPGGHVFLGFKEKISESEIVEALKNDRAAEVMHVFEPKPGDYIAIPPGCVHATGPGVLIAEPQYVLPGRSGKTWRLSDWGRKYNDKGERDPNGKPRELHVEAALSAIDWHLPRGKALETLLVRPLRHKEHLPADAYNPFPVQFFSQAGIFPYKPLVPGQFSLVTCWQGQLQLISRNKQNLVLNAGESGLVSAAAGEIEVALAKTDNNLEPCGAFFGFVASDLQGV
ncbi:MAG: hypothetical protein RI932_561 [Pseudomonadota bacterium]|jgi:mannose-6-phosphate isomerase